MERYRTVLLVAAIALALLSVAVYAVTFALQDQGRGVWASQALFGSAALIVLALNCLYWRWRIPRSPRLTGGGVVGRVAGLSALSVVAVTVVFVVIGNTIYTEPWSSIP